ARPKQTQQNCIVTLFGPGHARRAPGKTSRRNGAVGRDLSGSPPTTADRDQRSTQSPQSPQKYAAPTNSEFQIMLPDSCRATLSDDCRATLSGSPPATADRQSDQRSTQSPQSPQKYAALTRIPNSKF